ncbi:unnamed protein product [Lampetra fluviatilis]
MEASSSEALFSNSDKSVEEAFNQFYTEVKQIEKRDSVLTPKQQIERLTRPGSTYINLNPYEVLQLDPEASDTDIKKRFRQLSILVHPDKNQDDAERAQKAFEAVDKAYKSLLNEEHKTNALEVITAAREHVEHNIKEKKKQLKKQGKPQIVEEELDPEAVRGGGGRGGAGEGGKRQREEEIEQEESEKKEKEWQKNFEASRDGRVDSWRSFQSQGKKKAAKEKRSFLKPPKVKMEKR